MLLRLEQLFDRFSNLMGWIAGTLNLVMLLNVFYDGAGEVALNFTDHLRTDHPGGSDAEIATLRVRAGGLS